ncbi:MAG: acyltransferase [Bacteroidota bacterium]
MDRTRTLFLFNVNYVKYHDNFITNGVPVLGIHHQAKMTVGMHFRMNNGILHNQIGRNQRCIFKVEKNGVLEIGDNVNMSSTAIVCCEHIRIGNNVKIGGNVAIYDTDFHSLDVSERTKIDEDLTLRVNRPVIIEDNVFIGAHSTILKGVTIGKNAIIGAGSIVTKDVPPNEIWGGNPAKIIRRVA